MNAREYWQQPTLSSEDGQKAKTANGIAPDWIMSGMPSRVQTDTERRRREARVEQSMKIRSRSRIGRRFVSGSVSEYVRYLELSRESKHVVQQMRYQNVDLSNGHCLSTIIIF